MDNTLGHAARAEDVLRQPHLIALAKKALMDVSEFLGISPIFVLPNITVRVNAQVYWHTDYFFLRNAKKSKITEEVLHISLPIRKQTIVHHPWPIELIYRDITPKEKISVPDLVNIVRNRRVSGVMRAGDVLLWHGGHVHRSSPRYLKQNLATLQMTIALTARAKELFLAHLRERALMPGEENARYRSVANTAALRLKVQRLVGSDRVRAA